MPMRLDFRPVRYFDPDRIGARTRRVTDDDCQADRSRERRECLPFDVFAKDRSENFLSWLVRTNRVLLCCYDHFSSSGDPPQDRLYTLLDGREALRLLRRRYRSTANMHTANDKQKMIGIEENRRPGHFSYMCRMTLLLVSGGARSSYGPCELYFGAADR